MAEDILLSKDREGDMHGRALVVDHQSREYIH